MKKIIFMIILSVGLLNAGWFNIGSQEISKDEMLKATPFNQIKDKIGKEPMMLEFGATSCVSCQEMGKILKNIKQKHRDANIYFINLYDNMEVAKKYQIRLIPTQLYFDKSGKIIDRHIGKIAQKDLEAKLRSLNIMR